jgi:hypothetical protein
MVNREGMPLRGFVRDRNLSDKTWNGEAIDTLPGLLSSDELDKVIYVADAACVTPGCLSSLAYGCGIVGSQPGIGGQRLQPVSPGAPGRLLGWQVQASDRS